MKKLLILSTALFIVGSAYADLALPSRAIKLSTNNGTANIKISDSENQTPGKMIIQSGSINKTTKEELKKKIAEKQEKISSQVMTKKNKIEEPAMTQYATLKTQLELQLADLIKQGQGESEKAKQLKADIDRLTILITSMDPTKTPVNPITSAIPTVPATDSSVPTPQK